MQNNTNYTFNEIEKLFWWSKNNANTFEGMHALKGFWENPQDTVRDWKAPDGMFWICGERAYSQLPSNWKGSYRNYSTWILSLGRPLYAQREISSWEPKNEGIMNGLPSG